MPDQAEPQPEALVVSFHIDADLYVRVNQQSPPTYFKVHSALVAAASPVWRQQIYGGNYPRPAKGKWIINMNDDDDSQDGLDVVFSIAHYKFHDIPTRPVVEQLFEIAKIVSKYQCEHLVTPFMQDWVASINYHVIIDDSQNKNDDEKTLFVSWVFGEARWFAKCLARVAYKATIDDEARLVDSHNQLWTDAGLPTKVNDLIRSARKDALGKIFPAIEIPFQRLLNDPRDKTKTFCRAYDANDETREQCQLLQLGSLMSGLTTAKLLPVPEPSAYCGSVNDLAKRLKSMKVTHFKLPGVLPHLDAHQSCGIQHEQAIEYAMPSLIKMDEQLIKDLWLRSKKSGAFSAELFSEISHMMKENLHLAADDELKQNAAHYAQAEDFKTAPDYYSECDMDSVIEGQKDTAKHNKQDVLVTDKQNAAAIDHQNTAVVDNQDAAVVDNQDAAVIDDQDAVIIKKQDATATEEQKDTHVDENQKETDLSEEESDGIIVEEDSSLSVEEEKDTAVTEEKDVA